MLLAAMCLALTTLQEPQALAFRIEGESESRQVTSGRADFTPSNTSLAFVRVTARDSAGGVVLDIVVDSAHVEHRPPELTRQLPPEASAVGAGAQFRLFLAQGAEHAVAIGAPAPMALAQAVATLTNAYSRRPLDVREDTVSGAGGRAGFGRSTWTTRREYRGSGSAEAPLHVRSHRVSSGTGPAGGNLAAEALEQVAIVRGADGLPTTVQIEGTLSGVEVVASTGVSVQTTARWRYTLARLATGSARPPT
jgi:hypothetical protein